MGVAREASIAPGERVLIEAVGGGVGSLLVQLARHAGASVIIALARRLGGLLHDDYGKAA